MSQKRRKTLKAIKQDRPPFVPILPTDAQLIANAGGLDCANDSDFFDELDDLRDWYRARYRCREVSSTDQQLRAEIQDARNHIRRLRAFFSSRTVCWASSALFHFEPEQSGAVPHPEHPDRLVVHATQQQALGYLDDWVTLLNDKFERAAALRPNTFAIPSATNPGELDLAAGLAKLWRKRSGETELPTGRKTRWTAFLRQSVRIITQKALEEDAAVKLTQRALKHEATVEHQITSGKLTPIR